MEFDESWIWSLVLIQLIVFYFATLRQKVGIREERLQLAENSRVSDLLEILQERHTDLAPALPSTLVSINRDYATRDDLLHDGDEVALFPPVSGGLVHQDETLVRITRKALDMNQILADMDIPSNAAVCVFTADANECQTRPNIGTIEGGQNGLQVSMSEEVIHQIANEIRERWPMVRGIAIEWRVGRLLIDTPRVLIACASDRGEIDIFHAARFGIDRLTRSISSGAEESEQEGR